MEGYIVREVGARYLARLQGFDEIMPKNVFAKIKTPHYGVQVGSLRDYLDGGNAVENGSSEGLSQIKNSPAAMNDVRQIILFNHLAQNYDMSPGNWLAYPTNDGIRCGSIDHALTGGTFSTVNTVISAFPEFRVINLTEEEKLHSQQFISNREVNTKILRKFYPESSVNTFFDVAQKLLDKGKLEF